MVLVSIMYCRNWLVIKLIMPDLVAICYLVCICIADKQKNNLTLYNIVYFVTNVDGDGCLRSEKSIIK